MIYHVVWKSKARNDLANAWLKADSTKRKAITAACHSLETRLAADPLSVGESRDGNERIGFESPLVIFFEVDESKPIVRVLHTWTY